MNTLYKCILYVQEDELRTLDNSAQIFNSLSDVPGDVQDVEELIEVQYTCTDYCLSVVHFELSVFWLVVWQDDIYWMRWPIMLTCLELLQVSYRVAGSLTDMVIESQRRKHLAYLMADQGAIVNPDSAKNLPKQVSSCLLMLKVSLFNIFKVWLVQNSFYFLIFDI